MSSPLPVPSKAALTALRGLIVGTSCTLALITEDRRRRIKNAVGVIENGEKIKSARRYRAGGSAFALALEEETLLDTSGLIPWPYRPSAHVSSSPSSKLSRREGGVEWIDPLLEQKTAHSTTDTSVRAEDVAASDRQQDASKSSSKGKARSNITTAEKPTPFIQPISEPSLNQQSSIWRSPDRKVLKAHVFPSNDDIVRRVGEASHSRDPRELDAAARLMLDAIDMHLAPDNLDKSWIQASALLCRTYQELGRIGEASELLRRMLLRGPLEEVDYFDHEPLRLIESLLAHESPSQRTSDRRAHIGKLDLAVSLFLPKFTVKPNQPNAGVFDLGKKFLESSFAAEHLKNVVDLYWRCVSVGDDSPEFTAWVITQLGDRNEYKPAIRFFLTCYSKLSPSKESLSQIGDVVVGCVESAHDYKTSQVLTTLQKLSSGVCKMKTQWVMRLLTAHWRRHRNLGEVEALFSSLQTTDLEKIVVHRDGIYRVMIEIALEAGQKSKAESYLEEATAKMPEFVADVRLQGIFARFHAKDGSWEAVQKAFQAMKLDSEEAAKACSQAFVPVLKAYASQHTARETETFMRFYIDELKVPVSRYMVTLMANEYGSLRDFKSFTEWVGYCVSAGFKIDGTFSTAILENCRRRWKFPFRDLRSLFRKLRELNPDFVDKDTERIMVDAALTDSKYSGKAARGRVLSLRIDANKLPTKGKCAREDEVILAMKEAMAYGRPAQAVWIYKRALHLGMPFSRHALQLAVQAQLGLGHDSHDKAYELLRSAQAKDKEDVHSVINHILAEQLRNVKISAGSLEAFDAVQKTLRRFENKKIKLDDTSLNRAALTCLAAGHSQGAVLYALKAAKSIHAEPCYSLRSFTILLSAYAELLDVEAIRWVLAKALASSYREDKLCLSTLKQARKSLRSQLSVREGGAPMDHENRTQVLAALEDAIQQVVAARRHLRTEREALEAESIRIMRQAALDAGRAPVDFDSIPWLGGRSSPRIRDDDANSSEFSEEDDVVSVIEKSPPLQQVAVGQAA
ncbi:hypothetical protein QBC46DRAFT_376306 [Diplogelasinospora grovesii]|uniref:Pentatricopeptide repeat protein n=1 Tax=Diplogelasinospora grovesii TaxID=303347 RepID=A0AAN6NDL5_9PEZI|nr:hypothetical protein QBC46DRAFT_376306 [Diplogelasinospora grovesii]